MEDLKICAKCGKEFKPVRKNQKFCKENNCYEETYRKKAEKFLKVCAFCSVEFLGTKRDNYCSTFCKVKVKNIKNKQYREKRKNGTK